MCGLTKGLGQLVDQSWSVLEGELEGGTARRFLPQTENDDPLLRVPRRLHPAARAPIVLEGPASASLELWLRHHCS